MLRRLITTIFETQPENLVSNSNFGDIRLSSLGWLYDVAPCFAIKSNNINIITEPRKFYNTLLLKSKTAQYRITLASLYLGNGSLERELVSTIENNVNLQNGSLKVNLLFDYTRGSRGTINSRTIILPLLKKYKEFINLSLYHTPSLRGIYKKILPQRWNELIGVQHMKLYIFDDIVIISGANLSNDYFTNRQDRFYMIQDKNLADFFDNLISRVQEFSLQVNDNNKVHLTKSWSQLPYEGSSSKFIRNASDRIESYLNEARKNNKIIEKSDNDTWVFPLIEMGQLGIHHDSIITTRFLSSTLPGSSLFIATGYFNLTKQYIQTIIEKCSAKCKVIMAHPSANGFQGAKWPAGGIPAAYSLLAQKFKKKLKDRANDIELFEYVKKDWTFHSKGLWYYLPKNQYPSVTFVGSPNFGERSVKRDLESQIVIVTTNHNLEKKLHEEWEHLHVQCLPADTNRKIPNWVKATVFIFRNFF